MAFGFGVILYLLADSGVLDWLADFNKIRIPPLAAVPPTISIPQQTQAIEKQKAEDQGYSSEDLQAKALREYAKTVRRSLSSVESDISDQRKDVNQLLERLKAHRNSVKDKKQILDNLQKEINQISDLQNRLIETSDKGNSRAETPSSRSKAPAKRNGDLFSPLSYLEVVQNLNQKTKKSGRFEKLLFAELMFTRFIIPFDRSTLGTDLTPLGHLQLFTLIEGLSRLNKKEILVTHFDSRTKDTKLAELMADTIKKRFEGRVEVNVMALNSSDLDADFQGQEPEIWIMENELPTAVSMRGDAR